MKKFMMTLAFSATFLTACSSNDDDIIQDPQDPNELTPGIMQPVSESGASEGGFGWVSDVQAAPMPSSMQ